MKPVQVLVIAPYKGLDEIVTELTAEREDVTVSCHIANLNDAVTLLTTLNLRDYDCIISRGGTATMLKNHVSIPVYDVGLSALDALRAIHLAQNFKARMAVVGFDTITNTIHTLNELLKLDLPIYTITSSETSEKRLQKLKKEGFSIIVCDVITSQLAPRFGLNAVLVTSGYETVQSTLENAITLTKSYSAQRQESTHLTMAFYENPTACTIFDSKGKLISSAYTREDPHHVLNFLLEHHEELKDLTEDTEKTLQSRILTIHVRQVSIKGETYTYYYTRISRHLESRKIPAIRQIGGSSENNIDPTYYYSSHYLINTQDQIEQYSKTLTPLMISGERGTGKDQAAFMVHSLGPYKNTVFFQIDCENATAKNWEYLFHHSDSPLAHNRHTIYFRHVDTLPETIFRQLVSSIIDTNLAGRNRLIFSFVIHRKEHSHEKYMSALMKQINCLNLYLPGLRERPGDIPFLSTYYINKFNANMGKQIIGFDSKAEKAMQSFPWEANLDQFQRIIRELMMTTQTSYISYENTMRILKQETNIWVGTKDDFCRFDLNQTLDEINYDIVCQVLKEENNNHSKAAKRLGIARSTLWRILKTHD